MEGATLDAVSLSEKIERFAATVQKPQSPVVHSKVKEAGRKTKIASVAFVVVPLVLILLTKLIGGRSFMGDILSFGFTGLFVLGILYAASVWGGYYFANRSARQTEKWVAVGILERQKNYDDGIPVEMVHLELADGRRVTLKAEAAIAERAEPGTVTWATIKTPYLTKLA